MIKVSNIPAKNKIHPAIIKGKENFLFIKSVTAFLDIIGHKYPRFTDQHNTALWWTANHEKIVQNISQFSDGNPQIKASLLHIFGTLSLRALYFNELPVT